MVSRLRWRQYQGAEEKGVVLGKLKPFEPNSIVVGDCLEVMARMPDRCVDLVVTDPPYRLTSGGVSGVRTGGIFDPSVYDNRGKLFEVLDFDQWLPDVYRVLKDDADAYIMTNDKNMFALMQAAFNVGFQLHNILVWLKSTRTPNRWYMKQCEYILYFWKGRARTINDAGSSNVLVFDVVIGSRVHPTEKPIPLMGVLVGNSSLRGSLIFDPFMGSGTTAVAADRLGRKFFGCDISEEYVAIAMERIEADRRKRSQLSLC